MMQVSVMFYLSIKRHEAARFSGVSTAHFRERKDLVRHDRKHAS